MSNECLSVTAHELSACFPSGNGSLYSGYKYEMIADGITYIPRYCLALDFGQDKNNSRWGFLIQFAVLAALTATIYAATATNSTTRIVTTKVTPSYWRATFANPPFNTLDNAWYDALYKLIDQIANDSEVKVVVFDSSAPDFYLAHSEIVHPVLQEYHATLWGNITRLVNLPVLTVAAVRGIVRGGGAEFISSLDIRFGSRKAIFGQIEVGTGE